MGHMDVHLLFLLGSFMWLLVGHTEGFCWSGRTKIASVSENWSWVLPPILVLLEAILLEVCACFLHVDFRMAPPGKGRRLLALLSVLDGLNKKHLFLKSGTRCQSIPWKITSCVQIDGCLLATSSLGDSHEGRSKIFLYLLFKYLFIIYLLVCVGGVWLWVGCMHVTASMLGVEARGWLCDSSLPLFPEFWESRSLGFIYWGIIILALFHLSSDLTIRALISKANYAKLPISGDITFREWMCKLGLVTHTVIPQLF